MANPEDSMSKVNITKKFANITEYYKPRIAAELNGQHIKFVKLNSEFVFHHHENEDEMFLVVKGRFRMDFRDRHESDTIAVESYGNLRSGCNCVGYRSADHIGVGIDRQETARAEAPKSCRVDQNGARRAGAVVVSG